jgi:hypothetical protein
MVKRIVQGLLAIVVVAGGLWLWRVMFPGDETQIRRVLLELAEAASVQGGEGNIARLSRVNRILGCLTPEVEIRFAPEGGRGIELTGRESIQAAAVAAPQGGRTIQVEFIDIDVTPVPSGAETAEAVLTARVQVSGEREFGVQALKVDLAKDQEFGWRLKRLETFQPLSRE